MYIEEGLLQTDITQIGQEEHRDPIYSETPGMSEEKSKRSRR